MLSSEPRPRPTPKSVDRDGSIDGSTAGLCCGLGPCRRLSSSGRTRSRYACGVSMKKLKNGRVMCSVGEGVEGRAVKACSQRGTCGRVGIAVIDAGRLGGLDPGAGKTAERSVSRTVKASAQADRDGLGVEE